MKYLITMILALMSFSAMAQNVVEPRDTIKPIILEPIGSLSDTVSIVSIIVDKLNTPLVAKEYKVISKWYKYKTGDNKEVRGSQPYELWLYDPLTRVNKQLTQELQSKMIFTQVLSEWKK